MIASTFTGRRRSVTSHALFPQVGVRVHKIITRVSSVHSSMYFNLEIKCFAIHFTPRHLPCSLVTDHALEQKPREKSLVQLLEQGKNFFCNFSLDDGLN